MGMLWQRGMHISWLILHILYGTVDVESSLPVDLTPEEKVLPPTTLALTSTASSTTTFNISTSTYATAIPPIPPSDRDRFLTFAESGHHRTFMFAKDNTFIQLDGDIIQRFQLRLCREISFKFRTRLPHGLLVYHNVKNPVFKMQPYALYVIVEKGELKVVHVFGKHLTSVTVGRALNRDQWHSVQVTIDVHGARLIAKVDQMKEEVYLKGLSFDTNYGITDNLTSVILIGGLSSEEKLHGVKYIIESFVGCISDMVLSSGKAASDLLPIVPLIATKHENVKEGCIDKCRTMENLCFQGSRCINEYNGYRCDCFGTRYEEDLCDVYTATVLTLRGSSYVSYRVYDWKDRVHSTNTRVSLHFKTRFDDSALFYASGQIDDKHHYIALSVHQEKVAIQIDLGDGPIDDYLGEKVNDNMWHNLTVTLQEKTLEVYLDDLLETYEMPGDAKFVCIDPEIYICGGPDLYKMKGLKSFNNFAGNLKYVYYNDVSILYELKQNNPKVHYIGALDPEFEETDIEVIPITYPFATSHIWWPVNKTNSFHLIFEFKTSKNMAVLAYSETNTVSGQGYWEVRMVKEEIRFELVSDVGKNVTVLKSVKFDPNNDWHTVELEYTKGRFKLTVDNHNKPAQMFGYIGQNCHFATFRKTCEELALLGYTRNDVYLIDIDGNGKFPPAHVKIKYREFTAEMLQELISHSLFCRQYIKYDCNMAPLELHSATWFVSSSSDTVDYLGDVKRGYCSCGINATCANPTQTCNCDANENKWHADEGTFVIPKSLGITEMFFLQQKDLTEEAQGRITLGPLECVETNTQRYVVTFTTSQSYIEVPGWRKGDIAFSFRTTGTSAILLFQPPIRPNYPSFMVALTSEHELTFNFTLNTGTTRKLVINSKRKLNGGEWHKIWIDYNFYHVRFMLNTEYQMLNLLLEEEFGPFEGSMFIGGATATNTSTTLHVNDKNTTIDRVAKLLGNYTNKPWINPELEVIRPQRPPAPPTDYFQMNLGGYDPYSLHLAPRATVLPQGGYVGCVRGFKIADHVVDLPRKTQDNVDQDPTGVLPQCDMKCDSEPCKNGGVCTEDFTNQESSCNCELTSYFGEYCMEEKGADFNGESILQRGFVLYGPILKVKIKLAFSSNDLRQKNTVLLLVQTENKRSYYLLIAITQDGYLKFEEDREDSAYGAEVKHRNFLNGARHTVYYTRIGEEARLLIDRIEIPLEKLPLQGPWEVLDVGSNEVQIGGLNTSDPRLKIYKGYNGCLSNIFVEVNEYTMKPLEEYMMFTRDSEKVVVVNAQGVRSAQCSADFDEAWPERDQLSPTHNGSFLISGDKTWVEDPPSRVPYDSLYQQPDAEEENTDKFFIALIVIYILGLCYCGYHMWRTHKAHRLRLEKETDENIMKSKEIATKLQEPSFAFMQMKEGEEANKEGTEKKSNGVTVDVIPMNMDEIEKEKIAALPSQLLVTTVCHPMEYAKVLIQLGYEPLAPRRSTTLFGRPAMILPNVFQYIKFIKASDGFFGCYRGLSARVLGLIASSQLTSKVIHAVGIDLPEINDPPNIVTDDEPKAEDYIKLGRRDMIMHAASVVVSYPFHVVSVRMMASFIGKEEDYCSLFGAVVSIYRDDGIRGFFHGIVPKLLGDLTCVAVTGILAYYVNKYLVKTKDLRYYTVPLLTFVTSTLTYPLVVVSTCMAVAGSSLQAGNPPAMPKYPSWQACWRDLFRNKQHKRGSSLIF
ncbi:hypothetical protein MSG28_005270, partial [Choristoneura fumiferana]